MRPLTQECTLTRRHRRIDYTTGHTYHLPPDGSAPPPSPPSSAAASAAALAAGAGGGGGGGHGAAGGGGGGGYQIIHSEPVRPLRPDGSVDKEVLGRLEVRHDDSEENVGRRLALWDIQVGAHWGGSCMLQPKPCMFHYCAGVCGALPLLTGTAHNAASHTCLPAHTQQCTCVG